LGRQRCFYFGSIPVVIGALLPLLVGGFLSYKAFSIDK
jgi:hypothetical protein